MWLEWVLKAGFVLIALSLAICINLTLHFVCGLVEKVLKNYFGAR